MSQSLDEPYYVAMEIENTQCEGLRMLETAGIEKYALIDIRGRPRGLTRHLIKMSPEEFDRLPEDLFAETRSDHSGETTSAWFNTDGCAICNTILTSRAFLISARHVKGRRIVYSFVAPNPGAYQRIVSGLEAQGVNFEVLEVGKFKPRSTTLTEKQERVLWLALKMGFFEYPRKVTMRQLAEHLGMGLSSLSEIIRRALRRLLEDHF